MLHWRFSRFFGEHLSTTAWSDADLQQHHQVETRQSPQNISTQSQNQHCGLTTAVARRHYPSPHRGTKYFLSPTDHSRTNLLHGSMPHSPRYYTLIRTCSLSFKPYVTGQQKQRSITSLSQFSIATHLFQMKHHSPRFSLNPETPRTLPPSFIIIHPLIQ